jgi:hypothetical protein
MGDVELEDFLCRHDLGYFAEQILGMEIVDHHKDWSEKVARYDRIGINASRDHGKSYFFSFAYPIWRMYYHWIPNVPPEFKSIPKHCVGYIFSSNQENSIRMLRDVRQEIETNPKLQHLVPDTKEIWSATEIKLSNGAVCRARGYGVAVRGGHPGWLVADDVLSDENLYSELTRAKDVEYFYSAITPMVVPKGQIVVVGTPFHAQDLYNSLEENTEYDFSRFPAIKEKTGEALWPTRYSKPMLDAKKREVGNTRFTREYMCIPIDDSSSLFPDKVLRENYREDLSLVTDMTDSLRSEYTIHTGVDLAMSANVGADYTVITTVGIDKHQNRRLFDIRKSKGRGMTEQLHEIEDVYYRFKPERIFIEDNQFQRVFADELVRNTDLPVQGFTTTAHNKNSFERGVPSLQILFENQKFQIPRMTDRDRRVTDELLHELKCFTYVNGKLQGLGAHDDMVMSLWIANESARQNQFNFSFS